jgi:uncharacterized membrane protein YqjE
MSEPTRYRRVVEGSAQRTVIERANDNTLETVIFGLRLVALWLAVLSLVSVFMTIWTADLRWVATLTASVILGAVAGYLGFWTFGNEGWRRGPQG